MWVRTTMSEGLLGLGSRRLQSCVDGLQIVAVAHRYRVPAVCFESPRPILGKSDIRAGGERHVIVVVETRELAQLQVAGQRRRLGSNPLHQIPIADDCIGVMVNDRVIRLIVASGELCLTDRHADGIRQALPEGSGGDFDAGHVAPLRMPRGLAAPLPKVLDVVQR